MKRYRLTGGIATGAAPDYARRQKVKVIIGSTHKARITEAEQTILPRKASSHLEGPTG
jgi:hypothetical protein